jgi:hypothetical protein
LPPRPCHTGRRTGDLYGMASERTVQMREMCSEDSGAKKAVRNLRSKQTGFNAISSVFRSTTTDDLMIWHLMEILESKNDDNASERTEDTCQALYE